MTVVAEVQTLEPGAIIEVFELDASSIGGGILYFHAHLQSNILVWKGQEYEPWPIKAEDFSISTDNPPVPKLTVANLDGSISALCIYFQDLVGSILIRRRTLVKYLDAVNFPAGNPTADPTQEFPSDIWFVERKSGENNESVQFELSSPMDFNGVALPGRQIIANMCSFAYRGADCGYTGGPVADVNDVPTAILANDVCGKRLASCKLRFGENGQLSFGGFPAAGLMRT